MVERNVIQEQPDYQRESAVWSEEKQQLFIDSLLNGFDIPKIYLHDLRGKDSRHEYAVIDGKQRLYTIWRFLDGHLKLAEDFQLTNARNRTPPAPASFYSDLTSDWQELFKSIMVDVVLVQDATEDDIEELFSRLNNGEPLNAAEKRNAIGGDMGELIRKVAQNEFFKERLRFEDSRYRYYDVAAKFLHLEFTEMSSGQVYADLKKKLLDDLVKMNKQMPKARKEKLLLRVENHLKNMSKVFKHNDVLLSKQTFAPLYYLFVKVIYKEYGHPKLFTLIHSFLESFQLERTQNLNKPEESRDATLIDFGLLSQQGTNNLSGIEERVSILRRYFLAKNPDVTLKDKTRSFSEEERFVIWSLAGKRCRECEATLSDIEQMHADHEKQWAFGGETTLDNARCLCAACNLSLAKKVS